MVWARYTTGSGPTLVLPFFPSEQAVEAPINYFLADVRNSFFYFYIYSFLRMLSVNKLIPFTGQHRRSSKAHKPTLFEELVLGLIAGIASRAISTPLNIITLKIQTERKDDDDDDDDKDEASIPESSRGLVDIVKLIYKEQGLVGFWRGNHFCSEILSICLTIEFVRFPNVGSFITESVDNYGISSDVSQSVRTPQVHFSLAGWNFDRKGKR